MKRASLKTASGLVTPSHTPDVTDRLLKTHDAGTENLMPPPGAQARQPRRPKPSAAGGPGPAGIETDKRPALLSGRAAASASRPVAEALALTRQALRALQAAQAEAPARYDLGIRYRLDALAHHLEQVSQFILPFSPPASAVQRRNASRA